MGPDLYEYSDTPLTARTHCKRISQHVKSTFFGYREPDPNLVALMFKTCLKNSVIRQTGSFHHPGLQEIIGSIQVAIEFNVLKIAMNPDALEKLDKILGTSCLQIVQDIHES